MSETANTKLQPNPGTIRPCTAQGLIYRAYKRPYIAGPPAHALSLFASGYYGDAPWVMFFSAVWGQSDTYQLMEHVPTGVYFITTYYTATYCSGVGLPGKLDTVTIVDSYGDHTVQVETLL
jgi:hypothetical protein